MPGAVPRFEFRLFGADLEGLRNRLDALARPGEACESLELYFLPPGRLDINLKIRDDALELKALVRTRGDLQQWQPEFREQFPLTAHTLYQRLEVEHGVSLVLNSGNDPLDIRAFLQKIAGSSGGIGLANVYKQRKKYDLNDCSAEFVDLLVNGACLHSVALESEDPREVESLRRLLELEGRENVSYVLEIKRVLGTARLPEDAFYNAFPEAGDKWLG